MSENAKIRNAIIVDAWITTEDHGLLSAWLQLDYGGTHQFFGGYSLYLPKSFTHHKIESPAGHFIFRVMEIAGVKKWNLIVGKTVRALSNFNDIKAIGHIVNDDWFYPECDFKPSAL